jgi:hypothetical protein
VSPKPLPRFRLAGRVTANDQARLADGFPASVLAELGEAPEAVRLRGIAERFQRARELVSEKAVRLERVRQEDARREREALEAGRHSKPQAPKAEHDLAQARHELEVLGGLTAEIAAEVLAASIAVLPEAARKTGEAAEEAHLEGLALLREAQAAWDRAGHLRAEQAWAQELLRNGIVDPFIARQAGRGGSAYQNLMQTISAAEHEEVQREEEQARREREAEAVAAEPVPPGMTVWRIGNAA